MNKTASIQTRIDPVLKKQAQGILNTLHLSMSEAISLFLSQLTLHKGLPFDVKIPNELTSNTLRQSDAGHNLHSVDSIDELFTDLDK